jgi:hypothetical protein
MPFPDGMLRPFKNLFNSVADGALLPARLARLPELTLASAREPRQAFYAIVKSEKV